MDSNYNGKIDISQLSAGIWYVSNDKVSKMLIARKLEELPEAIVAAQIIPAQNEICHKIREHLRRLLPKEIFEEYIIRPKTVYQLYQLVVKEIAKHNLALSEQDIISHEEVIK